MHQTADHVVYTGVVSCIEFGVNIVFWCERALKRPGDEMKLFAVSTVLKINTSNTKNKYFYIQSSQIF